MARILLEYTSAHVRLVLRVYFNVILTFLGLVGDQCCKRRSERQLRKDHKLDITQTTGWLHGTSVAYLMYSLRRSPSGWLGIAMLLSGIFWLAADLVVSGFVVAVNVVDRCSFNTTSAYVVTTTTNGTKIGPMTPSNIGAVYDIVTGALATSQRNGGLTGVFRKANTDLTFRADEKDVVMQWQCETAGQDVTYDIRQDEDQLVQDLVSRGLMYGNYTFSATQYIGRNWYTQLAAWSSSVGDWSGELSGLTAEQIIDSPIIYPWDVRAAVDITPNASDTKVMRPYHCTLNTTAMDFCLGKIQASSTLRVFLNNMRSNVYRYFTDNIPLSPDIGAAIASTLNTILMMAAAHGAGNNIPPPEIDDPYQGCFKAKTQIPEEVIIVWILVTFTTIMLCVYYAILISSILDIKKQDPYYCRYVAKSTPNGLLDWMRQAVITAGTDVQYKGLSRWILTPSYDRQHLDLRHRESKTTGIHQAYVPFMSHNAGLGPSGEFEGHGS